jgi:hypothetical protein
MRRIGVALVSLLAVVCVSCNPVDHRPARVSAAPKKIRFSRAECKRAFKLGWTNPSSSVSLDEVRNVVAAELGGIPPGRRGMSILSGGIEDNCKRLYCLDSTGLSPQFSYFGIPDSLAGSEDVFLVQAMARRGSVWAWRREAGRVSVDKIHGELNPREVTTSSGWKGMIVNYTFQFYPKNENPTERDFARTSIQFYIAGEVDSFSRRDGEELITTLLMETEIRTGGIYIKRGAWFGQLGGPVIDCFHLGMEKVLPDKNRTIVVGDRVAMGDPNIPLWKRKSDITYSRLSFDW